MSNFEKITASPEALAEFLASLNVADGPWDAMFHKDFCADCRQEECDGEPCPHQKERNNPTWWLTLDGKPDEELESGAIVRLENPLRVLIRVAKIENPFNNMATGEEIGEKLETAWKTVEEVKRVHPNAEISVEVEV